MPNRLQVLIGDRLCDLFDAQGNFLSSSLAVSLPLSPADGIICSAPDLEAGFYNVSLSVLGEGVAQVKCQRASACCCLSVAGDICGGGGETSWGS